MSTVKVIKLQTKKNNVYKDILSSSSKVAEIIRRSKNKPSWYNNEQHKPRPKPKTKNKNKVSFNITEKPKAVIKSKPIVKNKPIIQNKPIEKILKKKTKKSIPISKYFTKKTNIHKENLFSKTQIIKFVKLIKEVNFKQKKKYIFKLNKSQLNQILFALKIIKKKSKADKKLLRTILILYFDTNVRLL